MLSFLLDSGVVWVTGPGLGMVDNKEATKVGSMRLTIRPMIRSSTSQHLNIVHSCAHPLGSVLFFPLL